MTVETELCSVERAWTGNETQFSTGFKAKSKNYVKVGVKQPDPDPPVPLSLGTHFDVTLAADDLATVIPVALPTPPQTLVIERQTPAHQTTNFEDLGRYSADVHEDLHDLSAMRDAELGQRIGAMEGDLDGILAEIYAALALLQNTMPMNVPIFATRAAVAAATIDASVKSLQTRGWVTEGDGGHWPLAVRVAVAPTHTGSVRSLDRYLPNGTTDAANGGWWEVHPRAGVLNFEAFGAVGDDVVDDTQNLIGAGKFVAAKNGGVRLRGIAGKTYKIYPDDTSAFTSGPIFGWQSNVKDVDVDFAGSTLHSHYLTDRSTWVFSMTGCQDITIRRCKGKDERGKRPFNLPGLNWGVDHENARNIHWLDCDLEGGLQGPYSANEASTPNLASSNRTVTGRMRNMFYATALQGGGHNTIVDIEAIDVGRALLAYNVRGLRGRVKLQGPFQSQPIILGASADPAAPGAARNEAALEICYDGTGDAPLTGSLVACHCNQVGATAGSHAGQNEIRLHFDVNLPSNNTNAPPLLITQSYREGGVLGTPVGGAHVLKLHLSGLVRGTVGAAVNFMELGTAAQGWASPSVFFANLTNFAPMDTARPIVVGAAARGSVAASCFNVTEILQREAGVQFIDTFQIHGEAAFVKDGIVTPPAGFQKATIYVDTADGDLKVRFADGVIKTIVVDT